MIQPARARAREGGRVRADNVDLSLIRDFVECITRDSEPLISGRDGLEALRVTLAAYESGRTHRPVPITR